MQSTYVTRSWPSAARFSCMLVAAMAGDSRDGWLYLSAADANANLRGHFVCSTLFWLQSLSGMLQPSVHPWGLDTSQISFCRSEGPAAFCFQTGYYARCQGSQVLWHACEAAKDHTAQMFSCEHRSCLARLSDWAPHLSPLGVIASRTTCMRALWRSIACTAATAPAATIAPVSVGLFVSCTSELPAQASRAILEPRMQGCSLC